MHIVFQRCDLWYSKYIICVRTFICSWRCARGNAGLNLDQEGKEPQQCVRLPPDTHKHTHAIDDGATLCEPHAYETARIYNFVLIHKSANNEPLC